MKFTYQSLRPLSRSLISSALKVEGRVTERGCVNKVSTRSPNIRGKYLMMSAQRGLNTTLRPALWLYNGLYGNVSCCCGLEGRHVSAGHNIPMIWSVHSRLEEKYPCSILYVARTMNMFSQPVASGNVNTFFFYIIQMEI